jgi:hypothetical protein
MGYNRSGHAARQKKKRQLRLERRLAARDAAATKDAPAAKSSGTK